MYQLIIINNNRVFVVCEIDHVVCEMEKNAASN